MGIPADKQDALFQPFQRAGQEAGHIQGTGIGLVITKRLARLMGGDVGFRSVLGEGLEFWVDMPAHVSDVHSSAPPPARERSSDARAHRPDAIIMDINLPGMSGTDALRELRARPETWDIPVIALAAAASPVDKRRGAEAGFTQYLTKPVNVGEFVAALDALFALSR
jgi:CheY-like chemotaxis protein